MSKRQCQPVSFAFIWQPYVSMYTLRALASGAARETGNRGALLPKNSGNDGMLAGKVLMDDKLLSGILAAHGSVGHTLNILLIFRRIMATGNRVDARDR